MPTYPVFDDDSDSDSENCTKVIDTSILEVNKQILFEAQEILMNENTFKCDVGTWNRQEQLNFAPNITMAVCMFCEDEGDPPMPSIS
jgi:hypothetical protein